MKSFKTPFLIATVSVLLCTGVSVSSANATQPKSLPAVSSVSGSISNGYNYCLGTGLQGNIENVVCPGQNWTVSKSSRSAGYQIGTKNCVTAAVLRDGENLQLASCGMFPAAQQDWIALPSGGIALVGSNFCLDVEVGVPKPNSPIQIYTCQGLKAGLRIPAQRWAYDWAMFKEKQADLPVRTPEWPTTETVVPKNRQTIPFSPTTTVAVDQTIPFSPTTTVAVDVAATVREASSKFDPSLPFPSVLNWMTDEPSYGKGSAGFKATAFGTKCGSDNYGGSKDSMVNFLLYRQSGGSQPQVLGHKIRVMNSKGVFLKKIFVFSNSPGCVKSVADSFGWIIFPKNCGMCTFFGFGRDDWPKNAILEVAQISQRGAGRVATVPIGNPKKLGPSRATCNLIKTLGYAKETLKLATSFAADHLPPPVNVLAGQAISVYFEAIDPPNPNQPAVTQLLFNFKNVKEKAQFYAAVAKLPTAAYKLSDKVGPLQVKFIANPLTFASTAAAIYSINSEHKNVGC